MWGFDSDTPLALLSISVGAAFGAILRWLLGLLFNSLWPVIPPGTLLANVLGGFLMGLALCLFAQIPSPGQYWRLFVITGFLGALTTFSTFTAEIGNLLREDKFWTAALGIGLHVGGSLLAFFAGIGVFTLCRGLWRVLTSF